MSTAMIIAAPAMPRALDRGKSDPPAPKTATVEPGSTLGGVECGADAGGHAHPMSAARLERHVRRESLTQRVLVQHDLPA